MRIKKGDKVLVIAGKHKGIRGIVAEINQKKNRVMLEEIKIKKHQKPKQGEESGKIVEINKPLPASNVQVFDLKAKDKLTRIGYRYENEKKVRFAKKSGKGFKT